MNFWLGMGIGFMIGLWIAFRLERFADSSEPYYNQAELKHMAEFKEAERRRRAEND